MSPFQVVYERQLLIPLSMIKKIENEDISVVEEILKKWRGTQKNVKNYKTQGALTLLLVTSTCILFFLVLSILCISLRTFLAFYLAVMSIDSNQNL
jgi:hypothetical protein